MPSFDKPLAELREYRGISPRPADFEAYWAAALAELDATDPAPELVPSQDISPRHSEVFDLWFTGVGGARIYAKYARPRAASAPSPVVLQFHGYSGNSGDWAEKLVYSGEGFAIAAMDCRGQGGRSEDITPVRGGTYRGQIVRGLDDAPEKLLFRSIFLDTVQLARVVLSFPEVDANRAGTIGASQGGALSLVCAALESRIKRCVSAYPFLSDYRRAWDLDLPTDPYWELAGFFRRFDPCHERVDAIFERLGYIDVMNHAPHIKAEVLMGISLVDKICPPSTQFAAYNNLGGPKQAAIYPDFGHEALPGFADKAFNFLRGL